MSVTDDTDRSDNETSRVVELRRAAMARRRLRENMERIASGDIGRGVGISIVATSVATSAARKSRQVVREAPLIAIGTAIAAGFLMGSRRRRGANPPVPKGWAPHPAPTAGAAHQTGFAGAHPIWTGLASLGIQMVLDALASRRFDTMEHGG